VPHYSYFNFDDAFRQASERRRLDQVVAGEQRRQNEIDAQARQTEKRNQRAAVQTKRHKQKKMHVQTPKEVPAFLKRLAKQV
jgi:Spy/CpxP family protein refolding chaperone